MTRQIYRCQEKLTCLYYLDCRLEFNSDFVVPDSWQTYLRLALNQPAGAEKRVDCMANNSSLHVGVPSPPPRGVTFPHGEGEGTATLIYLYLLSVKKLTVTVIDGNVSSSPSSIVLCCKHRFKRRPLRN